MSDAGYGMSNGCLCCESCKALSISLTKDIADVTLKAHFGNPSGGYIAMEFDVSKQTGFGFLVDSEPVLKVARVSLPDWEFTDFPGALYDIDFPTSLAEAEVLYAASAKGTSVNQAANIIAIVPTIATNKLLIVVPVLAHTPYVSIDNSSCQLFISRDTTPSTYLDLPTSDWRKYLTRDTEGIYETRDPLPPLDLMTSIYYSPANYLGYEGEGSLAYIFNLMGNRKLLFELFTRDGDGDETTVFSQTWDVITVEATESYDYALQLFRSGTTELDSLRFSNLSGHDVFYRTESSAGTNLVRWPYLIANDQVLQTDGTRGKIWHWQSSGSPQGISAGNFGVGAGDDRPHITPMQYIIRRRSIEFMPGYERDTIDRRFNGHTTSYLTSLFELPNVYARFGVIRGNTNLERFNINQIYEKETGHNELCPIVAVQQPVCPSYSQSDLYVTTLDLGGATFSPSLKYGRLSEAYTDYVSGDFALSPPELTVSATGSYAAGWTASGSSVSFPEGIAASVVVQVGSPYYGTGLITLSDTWSSSTPKGRYFNDWRHFWYDVDNSKWVYRGQSRVALRTSHPTEAEIEAIVILLADGGEFWYRIKRRHYSIDSSGEITDRDASEFSVVPMYAVVLCRLFTKLTGPTDTPELSSGVSNIGTTHVAITPATGQTTVSETVTIKIDNDNGSRTEVQYTKIVEAWNDNERPTLIFDINDRVLQTYGDGSEFLDYYNRLDLPNGASVTAGTSCSQSSPTGAVLIPYEVTGTSYYVTDFVITIDGDA